MPNFTVNVPALEKLLDYAASGIGSVAGPMLASWRARKEANALTIQAEGQASVLQTITAAQVDARNALAVQDVLVQSELSISEAISQRIQFQEEKRQRNLEDVVRQAAEELEDKSVPDEEPDHDWTARFFAEVQDVSSRDMQRLWAKILAGQVQRPGSTSIRSLTILRNLTKQDAVWFTNFCAFVWNIPGPHPLIYDAGAEIYTDQGVSYGVLTQLESLGLIKQVEMGTLGIRNLPKSLSARYGDRTLEITFASASGNSLDVGKATLTSPGWDLARVVDRHQVDGFFEYVHQRLESQNLHVRAVI